MEKIIDEEKKVTHSELANSVEETILQPEKIGKKVSFQLNWLLGRGPEK